MLFTSTISLLLLLATTVSGQFQDVPESPESSASSSPPTTTELDTSEPTLWQMAAFAARQMSTKSRRFKLATLTAAEQTDGSLYRLKVTLQRVANQGVPTDKNDLLFCTVEVRSMPNQEGRQQWNVENFGCTLPAIVRRRRPSKKVVTVSSTPSPVQAQSELSTFEQPLDSSTSYKYLAPVDNSIAVDGLNSLEDLPAPKRQYKRQTLVTRHSGSSSYFPQYVQYSPQPQSVRYLPYRPSMNYYYQAHY